MTHYLPMEMGLLFAKTPGVKLMKQHQTTVGWVFVIHDERNGQDYIIPINPITSTKVVEKTVCPSSIEELLIRGKI